MFRIRELSKEAIQRIAIIMEQICLEWPNYIVPWFGPGSRKSETPNIVLHRSLRVEFPARLWAAKLMETFTEVRKLLHRSVTKEHWFPSVVAIWNFQKKFYSFTMEGKKLPKKREKSCKCSFKERNLFSFSSFISLMKAFTWLHKHLLALVDQHDYVLSRLSTVGRLR